MNKFFKKENSGFTLIELMVSTSIFVIVMMASIGSLFSLFGNAKNSRALRFAMDNVNFAMESMTRSIRMGINYYCGGIPANLTDTMDCQNGGNTISFVPQNNNTIRVSYQLATRADSTQTLQRCENSSCVDMISNDVSINSLKFFVRGSSTSDSIQPSVYINIKGTVYVKGVPSSFSIQTLASQRNF